LCSDKNNSDIYIYSCWIGLSNDQVLVLPVVAIVIVFYLDLPKLYGFAKFIFQLPGMHENRDSAEKILIS
jgi:hypothetical protein